MAESPREKTPSRREESSIARQADAVLRKPARERLELLLHAAQPMKLVRTLPDVDLYLTVREVGPHDALPLMALASSSQIQHLMDLESWRGDRFDADRAGAWVAFFLESGEPTLVRFLRSVDDELLTLLVAKWMRVHQIEIEDTPSVDGHGETESGTEEGFLSPDGWHRFSPAIHSHSPAVRRIAEVLLQGDPERYERIVRDALWQLPSEVEERAFHWRNSRLEEHGFPPREEALQVFEPPTGARGPAAVVLPFGAEDLAGPRAVLRVEAAQALLAPAIDLLDSEVRERILFETAAIANRVLVADLADAGDPAAHHRAALAVAGCLEIALALRGIVRPEAAVKILNEVPILELFREGFAPLSALRERARLIVRSDWPATHARALDILDAPLRGVLSGLLLRRPAFYDASARDENEMHREFRSLQEVEQTRAALDLVEVLGQAIFNVLRWSMDEILSFRSREGALPKASALIATSLARFAADGELGGGPIPIATRDRIRRAGSLGSQIEEFTTLLCGTFPADGRAKGLLLAFVRTIVASFEEPGVDLFLVRRDAPK